MDKTIRSSYQSASFIYRIIDAVVILVSLFLSCYLYLGYFNQQWLMAGLVTSILFPVFAESLDLYQSWRSERYMTQVLLTASSWLLACLALFGLGYFFKASEGYSRVVVGLWFGGGLFVLCGWRLIFRQALYAARKRGHNLRKVVIVGTTDNGIRLAEQIHVNTHLGYQLLGFCDDRGSERLPEDLPVKFLGDADLAVEMARKGEVDRIYVALPLKAEDRIQDLLLRCSDTTATVSIIPDFLAYDLLHARWGQVGNVPTLSVYDTPLNGIGAWLKRMEDLILGSIILFLISIPMMVIAIGIKLTSAGPVLFKQDRYGLDGRKIRVWKFRSMTTEDNGSVVQQAQKGDARITKFGGLLRRTSLDELPQFINVLSGEMSIVGPRPHAVSHNEQYRKLISGYMLRHKMKPGITGLAQINGWRGETEEIEKMEGRVDCDLQYIRNWSLFLDLKIIFLTLFKGFTSKQAY